jgi:branched-chain amino acid aminotransferase
VAKTVDTQGYIQRVLEAWRPGTDKVLAFYEHRLGVIGTDPRLMNVPLDDHLVHRGDGVFETMKYLDGKVYQLDPHLRRMQRTSRAIHISPPCSWDEIRELCLQVAAAGEREQGLIRVVLGRGPGGFGIDPTECPVPSLYVVAYDFHPRPEEVFEQGVTAFRTSIPAKQKWLACIKSTNYLANVLMKREAMEKGYDFPLCFNKLGFLAEGATENVCMVDGDGVLVVPELSHALDGTTLKRAVQLLGPEVEVVTRPIAEDEIYDARELFLVGTTIDALAIVRYNDKPVHDARPGPVCRKARRLLQQDLALNGTPLPLA